MNTEQHPIGSYLHKLSTILGNDRTAELATTRQMLILQALNYAEHPIPGLEILKRIETANCGIELVNLGGLYSDLKRMRKKGWVELSDGDHVGGGVYRGNYAITKAGHDAAFRVLNLLRNF